MSTRISATVSKNRRRGRPQKYDLDALRRDPRLTGRSTRTLQNALYQERAQRLLDRPEHEPWVRWLIDPEKIRRGERGGLRPTILAELGRITHKGTLVLIARQMSETQPRTHDAVRHIRAQRLGRPSGWITTPEQLADRFITAINREAQLTRVVRPIVIRKAMVLVRKTLAVQRALEKGSQP